MRSYSSLRMGLGPRSSELLALLRREAGRVSSTVAAEMAEMRAVQRVTEERLGLRLRGLRVLEIGSGPNSRQLAYLAAGNDALGIDTNVVPRGLDPRGWVALVRHNGWMRVAKTLARRALLIDWRYRRETARALGWDCWPAFEMREMDATRLDLPDESVDFVFSRAVFEHIGDPGAAVDEIQRVLRPGGGMFVILHLYTSDSGCHDPRLLTGHRGDLPYWSHLRSGLGHLVRSNAYLNELRLGAWAELFASRLAGAAIEARMDAGPDHVAALRELRAVGKLAEYSDEELLSPTVWALWRKDG